MKCKELRDRLFEMRLPTGPSGGSGLPHEWKRHIAECGRCRARVERFQEANAALRQWMDDAPPVDLTALIQVASEEDEGAVEAGRGRRAPRALRIGSRRGSWLLGTAMAAAAASILLFRPDPPPDEVDVVGAAVTRMDDGLRAVSTPGITIPPNRNAAILKTRDPNITIIWFYGGD